MLRTALRGLKKHLWAAEQQLVQVPSDESLQWAALALRKCLEGVVLSSLVVNAPLLSRAEKAISKLDAQDALDTIRQVNPGFWPRPQNVSKPPGIVEISGAVDGALDVTAYGRGIGFTSDWLHWRNPLANPLDNDKSHANLQAIFDQLERLLRSFTLTLPGSTDLILCSINYGPAGARTIDAATAVLNLERQQDSITGTS